MADDIPSSVPIRINILSLNCWGLKYLSKLRNERLSEIGNQLAATNPHPHIVGLQECWTQQDYLVIREKTKHFLPHGKFYHSGIFGGGLVILSRWPIEESDMLRYPLNGRPAAFYRGDWFVGKGVASARIRIGPGKRDVAEVFCTHLHAPYEAEPFDSYICHRTAQAWEIAKKMRHAAERGHLVIGLGDFNMLPLSLAHQIIETQSPVRDVWRVLHPDSSLGAATDLIEQKRGAPIPSATYNLIRNGATCDGLLNTWRWDKATQKRLLDKKEYIQADPSAPDPRAKRLDYIFVSHGDRALATARGATAGEWAVESARVGMTGRHPTLYCSLSDHFSVEATISRTEAPQLPPQTPPLASNPYRQDEAFAAAADAAGKRPAHLPPHVFDDILAMVRSYDARERKQRALRIAHFWAQLGVTVACLVATWWSPRNFVAFLLMLLSSLGLAAGVLDGLMGFLFVGSELRALKEFEWEVRNARDRAAREGGGEAEAEAEAEAAGSGGPELAEEEADMKQAAA